MKEEVVNRNTIENLKKKISELSLEINKTAEYKSIVSKITAKLEGSIRFLEEYNKPINKEVIYLIYWSCINEYLAVNVKLDNKRLIYNNGLKISIEETIKYFNKYYKIKPSNYYCNILKVDLGINCTTVDKKYTEFLKNRLKRTTFNIHVLLLERKINTRIILLFDYLSKIRNNLYLIHGNENLELISKTTQEDIDNVNIFDCEFMLDFIDLLFLNKKNFPYNSNKLFRKEDKSINNKFSPLSCKLIDKIEQPSLKYPGKYFYKYLVEYSLEEDNTNIKKIQFDVQKAIFNKFNINDYLDIEYEINLSGNFNAIYARKITTSTNRANENIFQPLICKIIKKYKQPSKKDPNYSFRKYILEYYSNSNKMIMSVDIKERYYDLYNEKEVIEIEYEINYNGYNNINVTKISLLVEGPNCEMLTSS